ncbi:alkylhydroperoxidase/carboxymuconolactone decarboxylase family protein YurZ [Actinoplanes octamycinicus]|uniref:Alkylhydroperoxidase/carboxymuconolactone decarboxylase family protein YurZ n=1 Tax=Actinoplanes octamycinicus TaxID=135948 RepID=A0A7W7M8K9_9ACTN|nr:carboxymuconolactone decarboxylase family protein [Actinoplanes octamycinicus]MBB4740911.1 alkylhydroperoxidase/carboxymuconolactone decarboxylase family protein YurZ [Actinoplanes octamycinicus]
MDDAYLPQVYQQFLGRFPEVAEAQGALAQVVRERSPFDPRTDRLLRLAMAIGAQAEGAVRSNVRKALEHGATLDEVRAVALGAITTCGFPTAIAAMGWIEEVAEAQ